MADRTCPKCGKEFAIPHKLRRHLARKTPCEPIIRKKDGQGGEAFCCQSCNRSFTSREGRNRHVRENCKAQDKKVNEALDQKVQALQQQVAELLQQKTDKSNAYTTNNYIVAGHVVNNPTVTNVDNSRKTLTNNIDNSCKILNNNQGDVNQQITNFMPVLAAPAVPMPGWPAKWPPPQIDPKPFHQGDYGATLAQLRQASERLTAEEAAACQQGDAKAISALLMEVLRQVHADPRERNIYLSPDRGDQALIFSLHQWELNTLHEAMRSIFERMVKKLSYLPTQGRQHEKMLATGAKEGFQKKPADVVQSSNSAMTAHLKNMQTLLRVPGQIRSAEDANWVAGDEPPHVFGDEAFDHLSLKTTIYRMELDIGVEKEKDVTEDRYAELSCRAVSSFAWQVQHLRALNQTAVLLSENTALVHTSAGWEERSAAEVGEKIFRNFAGITADWVQGDEPTPLKPLGRYIETHMTDLALEERKSLALLRQYSSQAERVCATSTNPEFAKLKELMQAKKYKNEIPARPLLMPPSGKEEKATEEDDFLDALGWT